MTDMFALPTPGCEMTKMPSMLHIIMTQLYDTQHTSQPTPTNRLTNIAIYLS